MRFLVLAAAGAAFLAAGAAVAEDKKPENKPKMICKHEGDGATRLGPKVCKPKIEKKAEQEQQGAGVDGTDRSIPASN